MSYGARIEAHAFGPDLSVKERGDPPLGLVPCRDRSTYSVYPKVHGFEP